MKTIIMIIIAAVIVAKYFLHLAKMDAFIGTIPAGDMEFYEFHNSPISSLVLCALLEAIVYFLF